MDNFQNFLNEKSADVSLHLQNFENEDAKLKIMKVRYCL